MKRREVILLLLVIAIYIGVFMFYPRYSPLGEFIFNNSKSNEISLIFLTPSNQTIYKETRDKGKIMQLQNYLKEIEVKKIRQSTFHNNSKGEYYTINITSNSKLLYLITFYNEYIWIADTTGDKDTMLYLKTKNPTNTDFIKSYF